MTKDQCISMQAFLEDFGSQFCTCEDQPLYIAGQHCVIKASTSYEDCKSCNDDAKCKENFNE